MDMLKIALIGIAGVLLALFVKDTKPGYATYISLGTGILVFFYTISKLEVILEGIYTIQSYLSLNVVYLKSLVKIIGITYLAEFSIGICKDAGFGSVAGQIEVFSKLAVLAFGMPIITALVETIQGFFG